MGHPTRLNSVIARDTARGKRKVKLQWYHKNYLDHVYAVSDDNGNLVEHYRYTAFGEPEIYSTTGAKRNTSAIGNTVMSISWTYRKPLMKNLTCCPEPGGDVGGFVNGTKTIVK